MDAGTEPDSGFVDTPPLTWAPHVRGTFNDWQATDRMTYVGNRVYQLSLVISEDTHEFKVADENWSLATIFSVGGATMETIALDMPTVLVSATGFGNNTVLPIPDEGEYTFTLEVTDGGALTLTVTQGGGGPIDLPDDSQPETFDAAPYDPVRLTGGADRIPAPLGYFDTLAIPVSPETSAQYVLGDNIDGYYEGWTHAYTSASRYELRVGFLFSYFASLVNGDLNDLTAEATGTDVLPYGVRARYPDGTYEELIMHTRERALVVHRDVPATLAIIPKLNLRRVSTTFERMSDTMVFALAEDFRQADTPPFVAIAGDKPCRYVGADLEHVEALTSVVGIRGRNIVQFTVGHTGHGRSIVLRLMPLDFRRDRYAIDVPLPPDTVRVVTFDRNNTQALIDGVGATSTLVVGAQDAVVGPLRFVDPNVDATFPALESDDYLESLIRRGEVR